MSDTNVTLWTIAECAEWMRKSTTAIRSMLRRREFPAESVLKIGRVVRLRADLIKEWILQRKVA